MRRQRATGQALKTVCVHTNTVSYLNGFARGYFSQAKRSVALEGTGLGSVKAAGYAGDMLTDVLGIRTDLGPEDDIAAVRRTDREGEGVQMKEEVFQKARTFRICHGFVL